HLAKNGAGGMLTLPGDIPLVTAAEIAQLLDAHRPAPAFTIAPSHDELGSNAVIVSPPDAVSLRFGDNSFFPHLAAAEARGIRPTVLPLPGIALDIDNPDDLRHFAQLGSRDRGHGNLVSYSKKVFIPLTQLCRDVCHYCTFAHPPRRGEAAYLDKEQVLAIARAGAKAGCKEALFTLGDKPELRYGAARE